jgi:CBS domain-containing protein
MTREFTRSDVSRIAELLGVASEIDLDQLRLGMAVELEHGRQDPLTDVTADDPLVTAKIALAHLRELPDYYTLLARMEHAGEGRLVVRDLMTRDPITVRDRVPLVTADRLMRESGVSGLPVVNEQGALVGVISRTDLMAMAADPGHDPWQAISVASVMTSPALTIPADAPIADAGALMEERRVHRLVVVDSENGEPIGILSTTDLARALAGS